MPNHCINHLIITGPAEQVDAFKQKAVAHSPWRIPRPGEKPNLLVPRHF